MTDPSDDLGGAWPPPPLHYNPPDKPRNGRLRRWLDRPASRRLKITVNVVNLILAFAIPFGAVMLILWWKGQL